jgi:hypothetical protein
MTENAAQGNGRQRAARLSSNFGWWSGPREGNQTAAQMFSKSNLGAEQYRSGRYLFTGCRSAFANTSFPDPAVASRFLNLNRLCVVVAILYLTGALT